MDKSNLWVYPTKDFQNTPPKKLLLRSFTQYIQKVQEEGIQVQVPDLIMADMPSVSTTASSQHSPSYYKAHSTGTDITDDDLYKCLKPLLRFGRLVGLIPITGLFNPNDDLEQVSFSKLSLASITTVLIIITMAFHTVLRVIMAAFLFRAGGTNDTTQIAENVASVIFAISGGYVFYFTYCSAQQLLTCFHAWRQYKTQLPFLPDTGLAKSINLIAGVLLTSALLQNGLNHWNVLPSSKATNETLLENYYNKHFPKYSEVLPYNPVITLGLFLCDKLCVYAWTFADIFVAVTARAIYKQFQLHTEAVNVQLGKITTKNDRQFWSKIIKEHEWIEEMLQKLNCCLRPLIFACISSNIYFIAITLNRFLNSSSSVQAQVKEHEHEYIILLQQVNSVWSFLQLLAKTFTTIVCCARVHEFAHSFQAILWQCPLLIYGKEVERVELKLRSVQVGFTGLDYFTISKPFILTVFNVVFTFEIVLLQSSASSMSSSSTNNNSS